MDTELAPASLQRRFAAMFYDSILVLALLFVASIPVVILNGGEIRADGSILGSLKQWGFMAYLILIACGFYAWFWTHGGQTLGMSAWRIKVSASNGKPIRWQAAMIRALTACCGLCNLSLLLTKSGAAWHEMLSNSRTDLLPPKQ